ncbi:uncharacterized protein CELE_F21D12.2 [Caenorhabditis elegans]|uniref:Uncharacterized protein n=1 Tax=Caenorhabditis elegans TaxID=6239 RepID=Q19675_CAEEL|nr:Uncharacterized protein CELE_F21D12.2 [Caenorhabditis elegans]CCD69794.2 Uncharacterized protein CELE_F21D12.2 [Caenorhabditis elegans]|eukprot:NP_001343660.1 Uncharacterized protein CELE_F21D12.2 [Caenorhabditis elegans]
MLNRVFFYSSKRRKKNDFRPDCLENTVVEQGNDEYEPENDEETTYPDDEGDYDTSIGVVAENINVENFEEDLDINMDIGTENEENDTLTDAGSSSRNKK